MVCFVIKLLDVVAVVVNSFPMLLAESQNFTINWQKSEEHTTTKQLCILLWEMFEFI